MKNKNRTSKKIVMINVLCIVCLLLSIVCGLAYFSNVTYLYTEDGRKNAIFGVHLDLLFDKLDSTIADGTPLDVVESREYNPSASDESEYIYTYADYNAAAPWGSKNNPYIISEMRHLYNLSTLQNMGYFDKNYIQQNYIADGSGEPVYDKTIDKKPYFLICTKEGKPVTIDGEGKEIRPIGNDEYPFIGYVGGAFVEGTTTVGGKTTTVSVLSNIEVVSPTHEVDIGLFGKVINLGETNFHEMDENSTSTNPDEGTSGQGERTLNGVPSYLRNFMLCDVSITARDTLWDSITNTINHAFSYMFLAPEERGNAVHENHHVGILAGHAEYTTIELISVYYSGIDKCAIDLHHTQKTINAGEGDEAANYFSSSGILGFVYSMNPTYVNDAGSVSVVLSSGTSSGDISNSLTGGGGLLSGTKPGYVLANDIFLMYQGVVGLPQYCSSVETQTGENYGYKVYRINEGGATVYKDEKDRTLTESGTGAEKKMTVDGANPEISFTQYFYCDRDEYGVETYFKKDGVTQIDVVYSKPLKISEGVDENGNKLVTETSENNVNKYYFTDGVFTFAFTDSEDTLSPIWENVEGGGIDSSDIVLTDNATSWAYTQIPVSSVYGIKITPITEMSQITNGGKYLMGIPGADGSIENGKFVCISAGNQKTFTLGSGVGGAGATKVDGTTDQFYWLNVQGRSNFFNNNLLTFTKSGNTYNIHHGTTQMKCNRSWFFGYSYSVVFGNDNGNFALTMTNNVLQIKSTFTGLLGSTTNAYIYFNESNEKLEVSTTDSTVSNLRLYKVERITISVEGTPTYDGYVSPPTNIEAELDASQYVFYPTTDIRDGSVFNQTPAKSATPTYEIRPLYSDNQAADNSLNWIYKDGTHVSNANVNRYFSLSAEMDWSISASLFGLNLSSSAVMRAPVGSDGYVANVPLGSVAFKINKIPLGGAKIRTIVVVPNNISTAGALGYDNGTTANDEDYYLGLWKENKQTFFGFVDINVFSKENVYQMVELPRSQRLGENTSGEAINVTYQGNSYKTYLQGEKYLLAYEFTVQDTGVYTLGVSHGAMQMVYFSADGVASEGRDGMNGSNVGTIDFVYSYNDAIIPVSEKSVLGENNEEIYTGYYPSNVLLITDNRKKNSNGDYVRIYDEKVFIHREISVINGEEKVLITLRVESDDDNSDNKYVKISHGMAKKDEISQSYVPRSTP